MRNLPTPTMIQLTPAVFKDKKLEGLVLDLKNACFDCGCFDELPMAGHDALMLRANKATEALRDYLEVRQGTPSPVTDNPQEDAFYEKVEKAFYEKVEKAFYEKVEKAQDNP